MVERDAAPAVHRIEHAYVNFYLVEEGPRLTLVDCGHPRSWRLLNRALAAIGRSPRDLEAIVLTHAHFDHMGFARRAAEELALPLYVHAAEVGLAAHPWRYEHERGRGGYLRYPGFRRALAAMAAAGAPWVRGTDRVRAFDGSGPLDVPGRLLPLPTPGHTRGHCALLLPGRGTLIAGDAVVTHNPYTGGDGPQIVAGAATADSARALASLDAIAASGAEVVLTGHGPPWRRGAAELAARAREAGPS